MVEASASLIEAESPSSDPVATARCAQLAEDIGRELLGRRAESIVVDGRTHLRWCFGAKPHVLLIGHLDTVWPLGTLTRSPFVVDDDKAIGPGSFDMKCGVVQLFFALSALDDLEGVAVLLTTDEEIGSPSSRELIRETADGARAALVLEPSAGGALKTARKGVSAYLMEVRGRAAHAGLEPEKGINATLELAHQVLAIEALS
jgi:glutamate carboxypeptidase